MGDVVHMFDVEVEPDKVVAMLEELLERARTGEVKSMTVVAQAADKITVYRTPIEDLPNLLGHLDIIHAAALDQARQMLVPTTENRE